jgi:hypothetical protein
MFSPMAKGVNLVVKWALDPDLRDKLERQRVEEKLGTKKEKSLVALAALRAFLGGMNAEQRRDLIERERLRVNEMKGAQIKARLVKRRPGLRSAAAEEGGGRKVGGA